MLAVKPVRPAGIVIAGDPDEVAALLQGAERGAVLRPEPRRAAA